MQFAWLDVYWGSSCVLRGFGIQVLALHCHIRECIWLIGLLEFLDLWFCICIFLQYHRLITHIIFTFS